MPQREIKYEQFSGLDLRMGKETSPIRTLRQAINVDLTRGGGVTKRNGLRPVVTLDAESKGLYVLGGSLRAIIPSGRSIAASATGEVQVIYDAIGTSQNVSYTTGTVAVTISNRTVNLTSGTFPTWVDENSYLAIGSTTFQITTRNSATQITLRTNYTGVTASGLAYKVYGVQAVAYPTGTISRVRKVEGISTNAAFGQYPYAVIERTDGVFEHHWIRHTPSTVSTAVSTKVNLPFSPGAALIKMAGKLWTIDNVNGVVRFSSAANGPSDWVTTYDAGSLAVLAHVSGAREIQGLGQYDNKLTVFFGDAVQLWQVASDPAQINLDRVLSGPGTEAADTIANVSGDVFYFSQGGFRSLATVALTGQIKEDDSVGAPVYEMTKDETADNGLAVWSQARGQYLCAFGSRIYAYRYSPKLKLVGWTIYEASASVDAMVEFDGFVYVRSGTTVYRLDPDYDDGCTFTAQPGWVSGAKLWRFDFLEVVQTGTADVTYLTDPRDDGVTRDGPTITGTTTPLPLIAVGLCSQALSLVFTGTDPTWQLDRLTLTATPLGR